MFYIILFAAGWWTGRNWDYVKQQYNEKVKPKIQNAGKATKID